MLTARLSGIVLASCLVFACGGNKAPITPDKDTMSSSDADSGADMPSSTVSGMTGPSTTPSADPPKKDPPPSIALPSSSAKITVNKKKTIEIKSDGGVMVGGKSVGKVAGADMQDADGKTMMSVAADGSVTTADGTNVGTFAGDELTLTTGDKYSVADDGTLSMTLGGKTTANAGKATGLGSAKRALALAAYVATRADASGAPVTKPMAKPVPKKKK